MKVALILLSFIISASVFSDTSPPTHYLKPGAAIRIVSPNYVQMPENAKTTQTIELSTPSSGSMHLHIQPKHGIHISTPSSEFETQLSNLPVRLPVTIRSGEAGRFHVMFHARITQNQQTSIRTFGLPIYVGEPTGPNIAKDTPRYIRLPAQETITPY